MSGLEVNIVGALAELLRDRYRRLNGELPILKEIVQNADDAGANKLHLVLLEDGLTEAQNPLLRGPALICINDGPFTKENAKALGYLGLTSKASDLTSVGRFGLGQKSVFHLSEAYFYLGRSSSDAHLIADIINPWQGLEGDLEHPEWKDFGKGDQQLVQILLEPLLNSSSFFVLYLPLRCKEHSRKSGSVISRHFPKLDELERELLDLTELGALLSQLGSVCQLTSWALSNSAKKTRMLGRAEWASQEPRPLDQKNLHMSRPSGEKPYSRAFGGTIEVSSGAPPNASDQTAGAPTTVHSIHVWGFEQVVQDPGLNKLTTEAKWPRRMIDPIEGLEIPEKAIQHGAITVQHSAKGPAGLKLGWAIFLPLGTKDLTIQAPGVNSSWRIWFHAYGFPDSGRRAFMGLDEIYDDPAHLPDPPTRWNARLIDVATFVCLLDALAPAVEAVDADEGESVTRALLQSDFWPRHQTHVKGSFRLTWGPAVIEGEPTPQSRPLRIPVERRLLRVPRPGADKLAKVAGVLRALAIGDSGPRFAWESAPIVGLNWQANAWAAEDLAEVLDRLETRSLKNAFALSYLAEVIDAAKAYGGETGQVLPSFLRRCFRDGALTSGGLSDEWRRLAAQCPPGVILWSSANVTLLRELAQAPTSVLLLRADLRPSQGTAAPSVSIDDARTLLRILSLKVREERAADAGIVIAEIVRAVGPAVLLKDAELCELPLFRVRSVRARRHFCVTSSELAEQSRLGLACQNKGIAAPEEAAKKLCACLGVEDADIFFVEEEAIADAMNIPVLDLPLIARALRSAAAQAAPEHRLELFKHIAFGPFAIPDAERQARDLVQIRQALRFLIHGDTGRVKDDSPLLLPITDSEAPPARIVQTLLCAMGSDWRFVGEGFGNCLSMNWQAALGIRPLTMDTLIAMMSQNAGNWRREIGSLLGVEGRIILGRLLAVKQADSLFASLAIHETRGGAIVKGGDPNVWLEGQWGVPPSLAPHVDLIALSEDPTVREAQARSLHPRWSPEEQISICLRTRPSDHTQEILDAVREAPLSQLGANLRGTAWLRTSQGHLIKPEDILDVPLEVDLALRPLLGDVEAVFHAPHAVDPVVSKHPAFAKVRRELALCDEKALGAIALQLDGRITPQGNPFWILAAPEGEEREFLECGLRVPCFRADPMWRLLHVLETWMPSKWMEGASARLLLRVLRTGPNPRRMVTLLQRFKDENGLSPDEVELSHRMFGRYLTYAARRDDFISDILPHIHLLNTNKTWRPSSDIAASDSNFQDHFKLFAGHRQMLESVLRSVPEGDTEESSPGSQCNAQGAANTLAEYFGAWGGCVSAEAIGYFLACLGDGMEATVRALAHRYLHPAHTVDGARETILYEYPQEAISLEFKAIKSARWAIEVVDVGTQLRARSLAGTLMTVTVSGSALSSLFVGRVPHASTDERRLQLRRVDLKGYDPASLHKALGASIRAFLQSSVSVSLKPDFDVFWAALRGGGQAQVNAVRSVILDHLHVYLDALKIRQKDERLRTLLIAIDRADQRYREQVGNRGLWDDARRQADKERQRCHEALKQTLEKDEQSQRSVVRAVRAKLADSEYTVDQVLFELFQNADDAASELLAMTTGAVDERTREMRISIDRTASCFRLEHCGRPINRAGPDGADAPAYELDLKNMLVLNLSDKDEASTGRFGLGFKSVHLVTHRPRVRSGDLSFEIVGCLLPYVVAHDGAPDLSTHIELPLDEAALADKALVRVVSHGTLLPVFARSIRRLVLGDGEERKATWEPVLLGEEIEVGAIPAGFEGHQSEIHVLVFRGAGSRSRLALAFQLGARGVEAFRSDLAEIWCTSPTLERWGMGYCVNAPFALDIGRGQLARGTDRNESMFRQLGELLASTLRRLADMFEEDPERVVAGLGLSVGAHPQGMASYSFWRSMFERLTELPGEAAPDRTALIRKMHAEAGMGVTVAECRVLPTCLWGEYETLTKAGDVLWVLDEAVSASQVFEVLKEFDWFRNRIRPGNAIHVDVERRLARIGVRLDHAQRLGFKEVLEKCIASGVTITPDKARQLDSLRRVLDQAANLFGRPDVLLRDQLGRAHFETVSGKPCKPSLILFGRDSSEFVQKLGRERHIDFSDELMRAEFAGGEHVLSPAYSDQASIDLFFFARQRLERGDFSELARWACTASDDKSKRAVLMYLATGEQADRMSTALKQLGGLAWCQSNADLELILAQERPSDVALAHLRIRLGFHLEQGAYVEEEEEAVPEGQLVDAPADVLDRIVCWWASCGDEWSTKVDDDVYRNLKPGFHELANALLARRPDAWMLLFTLAACQRFGRQSGAQHAGFVRLLQTEGTPIWWTILAKNWGKPKADEWIRLLDQWLDARITSDQYRQWLGLFPTLYQLHRHGVVYQELLVRAGQFTSSFSLDTHLAPRANPNLTGSGSAFDAPPLSPALGLGSCWLLRELVRHKVIKPEPHLVPFCYVPREPTVQLMRSLGAEGLEEQNVTPAERSRRIHAFLKSKLDGQATFGGAFDLPLYLYATNSDARQEAENFR